MAWHNFALVGIIMSSVAAVVCGSVSPPMTSTLAKESMAVRAAAKMCIRDRQLLHLVAGDDLPRRPDVDFTYLAVDDCLAAHGLEKPSDLYLVKDRFDERSLVTVMRYACTIAHLDSMNAFANSEQVFRERLLRCV